MFRKSCESSDDVHWFRWRVVFGVCRNGTPLILTGFFHLLSSDVLQLTQYTVGWFCKLVNCVTRVKKAHVDLSGEWGGRNITKSGNEAVGKHRAKNSHWHMSRVRRCPNLMKPQCHLLHTVLNLQYICSRRDYDIACDLLKSLSYFLLYSSLMYRSRFYRLCWIG